MSLALYRTGRAGLDDAIHAYAGIRHRRRRTGQRGARTAGRAQHADKDHGEGNRRSETPQRANCDHRSRRSDVRIHPTILAPSAPSCSRPHCQVDSHPAPPRYPTHPGSRASPFRPRGGSCPPSATPGGNTGKHRGGETTGRGDGGATQREKRRPAVSVLSRVRWQWPEPLVRTVRVKTPR